MVPQDGEHARPRGRKTRSSEPPRHEKRYGVVCDPGPAQTTEVLEGVVPSLSISWIWLHCEKTRIFGRGRGRGRRRNSTVPWDDRAACLVSNASTSIAAPSPFSGTPPFSRTVFPVDTERSATNFVARRRPCRSTSQKGAENRTGMPSASMESHAGPRSNALRSSMPSQPLALCRRAISFLSANRSSSVARHRRACRLRPSRRDHPGVPASHVTAMQPGV